MEALGSLVAGAANASPFNKLVDFGFGQASNQLNSDRNQKNSLDLFNTQADRRESAFTQYGLPKYMAYSGGMGQPQQRYQLAGNNFQSIGPMGSKIPFNANPFMRRHGYGIEGPEPNPNEEIIRQSQAQNFPDSSPQNDQPPPYESKQQQLSRFWPDQQSISPPVLDSRFERFSRPTPRQPH